MFWVQTGTDRTWLCCHGVMSLISCNNYCFSFLGWTWFITPNRCVQNSLWTYIHKYLMTWPKISTRFCANGLQLILRLNHYHLQLICILACDQNSARREMLNTASYWKFRNGHNREIILLIRYPSTAYLTCVVLSIISEADTRHNPFI